MINVQDRNIISHLVCPKFQRKRCRQIGICILFLILPQRGETHSPRVFSTPMLSEQKTLKFRLVNKNQKKFLCRRGTVPINSHKFSFNN